MEFTYYYEETSQNTNCWVIKSEDMLTENEIMELSTLEINLWSAYFDLKNERMK